HLMKKALSYSSLVLLAVLSVHGCKAISDATTVSKDFSIDIVRDLGAGGPNTTLSKTDTADLTQISSDFAQYKDNVTAMTVDSAWYEINPIPAPTPAGLILKTGSYSVAAPDGTGITLLSSIS